MAPPEVRFRYVDVPANGETVSGFALVYSDPALGSEVATVLADYISAPGAKKHMRVEFAEEGPSTYRLVVSVVGPSMELETVVSAIDASYIRRLEEFLAECAYYFILIGHEVDGEFEQASPATALFKNDVVIDGRLVRGVPRKDIGWEDVAARLAG